MLIILLFVVNGLMYHFHVRTPTVDLLIHYIGGFLVALYLAILGDKLWPWFHDRTGFFRFSAIMLMSIILGIGVEMVEYLDQVWQWNFVPGDHAGLSWETKKDLMADTAGSFAGTMAYLTWFWIEPKPKKGRE